MLALVIIPVLVAVLAMWLLGARYTDRQKLRAVDYVALTAAVAPFVCVVVWFLMMI
jgi:TctA family transporter